MNVTKQDISPFASLHKWLNRVKNGIQYENVRVGTGIGIVAKQEQKSNVSCTNPTTNPVAVAVADRVVKKKKASPSALVRLYLAVADVSRTMAASPIYDTLGTSSWPTMYMPPSKRQYTFDQHNPSHQKIALSISSHILTESFLTSKTGLLEFFANAPYTHAEQWNRTLSIWSHWKSMIQRDTTTIITSHYTFHVRVIYPKAPNWNGSEKSSQTRYEKIRNFCSGNHLLPTSHIVIGPMTKLCESRYQEKTLECALGRAIHEKYGWKCKLQKPDIQFLVTFQDDVMQIGITMYHASYDEYLIHLSHAGPHSILHTIQHIHDAPHTRYELSPPSVMSQYHVHASIQILHALTLRMLRTKSFLDSITQRSKRSVIDACSQGEFELAHILIQLGCDIYVKDANTLCLALLGAISGDHYSIIALVLTSLDITPDTGITLHGYDILTTFAPIIEHAIQQRCRLGLMQILDYVEKKLQQNGKNEKYESRLTSWFLAACATHDMILIEPFIMLYLRYHHTQILTNETSDVNQLTASMTLINITENQFQSTHNAIRNNSSRWSCISNISFASTNFGNQLQHHITKLAKRICSTTLSIESQFSIRYVNTMKRILMSSIHQQQKQQYAVIAYMSQDEINIIMSYCIGNVMEWNKK